ncbi:MAG: hypothetical protein K6F14_07875 [Clostridiales bacterium]|nr:hypothetical protein [Clostridiales bacterium]
MIEKIKKREVIFLSLVIVFCIVGTVVELLNFIQSLDGFDMYTVLYGVTLLEYLTIDLYIGLYYKKSESYHVILHIVTGVVSLIIFITEVVVHKNMTIAPFMALVDAICSVNAVIFFKKEKIVIISLVISIAAGIIDAVMFLLNLKQAAAAVDVAEALHQAVIGFSLLIIYILHLKGEKYETIKKIIQK